MASSKPEPVKVVLIDTQYIQTDPLSFKSVVQSLTGKDSCVAWIDKRSFRGGDDAKRKRSAAVQIRSSGHRHGGGDGGSRVTDCNNISLLSRGMSFKDLDRMMLEIPSMEDLQYWLSEAQNN